MAENEVTNTALHERKKKTQLKTAEKSKLAHSVCFADIISCDLLLGLRATDCAIDELMLLHEQIPNHDS